MDSDYSRVCDTLADAVLRGTLASAYVFVGSSKSNREAAVDSFCGILAPSVIISLTHEAEGSGLISVSDVRDVLSQVSRTTFEGGRRVVLCTAAECLTQEAGNALLKCIEEPPVQTLFIFAAQHEQALLPTVVSRCAIIRLPISRVALTGDALLRYERWREMLSLPLWQRMVSAQAGEGDADHADEREMYIHHLLHDERSSRKDYEAVLSYAERLRELYRFRSLAAARSANDRLTLSLP